MKNYSNMNWIVLGGSFIIGLIGYISVLSMFSSMTYDFNSYGSIFQLSVTLLMICLIFSILVIVLIVRYFQYLGKLKQIGDITCDYNLRKSYKMEIINLISIIVIPFLISFFLLRSTSQIFTYEVLGYIVYLNPYPYVSFSFFYLFIFIIFIVAIVVVVLRILSATALNNWAINFASSRNQDYSLSQVVEGTNLIKMGNICAIVPMVSIISPFMIIIGFGKAGTGLMNYSRNFTRQPSYSHTTPVNNHVNAHFGSTAREMPYTFSPHQNKHCGFCGVIITEINAKFCPQCGNRVINF